MFVNEKRLSRYIDKIDHIRERVSDISEWIGDASREKKAKLAVYKAAQEIVEAVCDIIAMSLKDEKHIPKDDYTNIERWGEIFMKSEIAECLKTANGLRNRLVHHYNGINDKLALDSILEVIPCVEEFIETVKKWLGEKT